MKRFYNYTFRTVCVFILLMTLYSVTIISVVTNRNYANNLNDEKIVSSVLLARSANESIKVSDEIDESQSIEIVEEVVEEIQPTPTPVATPIPTPVPTPVATPEPQSNTVTYYNPIDTSSYNVISSEVVNISHFGPDCNGCGAGYVATGDYVGNGRIYYKDNTFGAVKIVAADKKYPSGTILRLTYNGNVSIAIVLDRGGGIGDGRKYQIDLLAESEAKCYQLGVMYGATLEVLRLGY